MIETNVDFSIRELCFKESIQINDSYQCFLKDCRHDRYFPMYTSSRRCRRRHNDLVLLLRLPAILPLRYYITLYVCKCS